LQANMNKNRDLLSQLENESIGHWTRAFKQKHNVYKS
jgi:hypothetical protein